VVSADASLPGDIFRARNGKTIQVENTDAEGRLTLTDGLFQAGEEKATQIIDVATLTGACVRALGTSLSGIMGTDQDLINQVMEAGAASGEDLWQLPLYEEYRDMLKTPAADINNITGTPNGGATAAGLFLREFVPEGTPWAHIDIAGTSFYEKKWKYFAAGGSGVMVRTLARLARRMAEK
jgi:leucyl aminopeptidase